jgi:head-tail adaptor
MSLLNLRLGAAIQRIRDQSFTTSVEVLRRVPVSNNAGGVSETWVTDKTYRGRLRHARTTDYIAIKGEQVLPFGQWIVMLPIGAQVDTTCRVRCAGRTFSVIASDGTRSDALVQTLHCVALDEVQ